MAEVQEHGGVEADGAALGVHDESKALHNGL